MNFITPSTPTIENPVQAWELTIPISSHLYPPVPFGYLDSYETLLKSIVSSDRIIKPWLWPPVFTATSNLSALSLARNGASHDAIVAARRRDVTNAIKKFAMDRLSTHFEEHVRDHPSVPYVLPTAYHQDRRILQHNDIRWNDGDAEED